MTNSFATTDLYNMNRVRITVSWKPPYCYTYENVMLIYNVSVNDFFILKSL
jgi:hypothetical protein